MDASVEERLIDWGYAVCDAVLRAYFNPEFAVPKDLSYPAADI